MKSYLSAAAIVAACFVSSAAQARDGKFYVGAEAGVMFVNDIRATASEPFNIIFPPLLAAAADGPDSHFQAKLDTGLDADLVVGYDFGKLRAELELGYRRARFDDVEIADDDFFGGEHDASGTIRSKSAMINVMADLPLGRGVTFSAGPGIGWSQIKADPKVDLFNNGDTTQLQSHKDSGLMVQGVLGLRKEIGANLDLGVKYRFVRSSRREFDSTLYGEVEGRLTAHSILATLHYSFGK